MRVIWDNGNDNGNYYYVRVIYSMIEKMMETTTT